MPDWHVIGDAILQAVYSLWMVLGGVGQAGWAAMSARLEELVHVLEPHPDAVAGSVYLLIVSCLVMTSLILHPHIYYFLRRHRFGLTASGHVWYLALAFLLLNGSIHAAERAKLAFDVVDPPILYNISVATKFALIGNAAIFLIGFVLCLWHIHDRRVNILKGFRTFFTPVFGMFGTEHLVSMYCEHYDLNNALGVLLKFLVHQSGATILQSLVAFFVIAAIGYLIRTYGRHRLAALEATEPAPGTS